MWPARTGVSRALELVGAAGKTVFVGHELSNNSKGLLESGAMQFVIAHDFTSDLTAAARWIRDRIDGVTVSPSFSQILVHTRYNCS